MTASPSPIDAAESTDQAEPSQLSTSKLGPLKSPTTGCVRVSEFRIGASPTTRQADAVWHATPSRLPFARPGALGLGTTDHETGCAGVAEPAGVVPSTAKPSIDTNTVPTIAIRRTWPNDLRGSSRPPCRTIPPIAKATIRA